MMALQGMNRVTLDRSLVIPAVALVAVIAVLAGGTLWTVRRMQHHLARAEAARAVIAEGESILAHLVQQNAVTSSVNSSVSWEEFSQLVDSLRTLQHSLQYVSVRKGDMTVFHEQASEPIGEPPGGVGPVQLRRLVLQVGDEAVPVVAFSQAFETGDLTNGVIEAAFRIDAVGNEERAATKAIASMFRLSLATVIVAFFVCAIVVLWVMRREALRERLQRQQEHLAFSGVLANGIAHDFRNPMSSLRLDVQMLQRQVERPDLDKGKVQSLCGRILNTLERMDKVFQEFLYLSRPPSTERESVDLVSCVRECIAMLTPRLETARLCVETSLPDEPVSAWTFPGSLRRAIVNILINAEQFSPAGTVIALRLQQDGARAVLEVEDSGPGIPKEDRQRVFDMFATSRPEGTGLGLFLAKTAVERSGGMISAVDGKGSGACLRITLPLERQGEGDTGV